MMHSTGPLVLCGHRTAYDFVDRDFNTIPSQDATDNKTDPSIEYDDAAIFEDMCRRREEDRIRGPDIEFASKQPGQSASIPQPALKRSISAPQLSDGDFWKWTRDANPTEVGGDQAVPEMKEAPQDIYGHHIKIDDVTRDYGERFGQKNFVEPSLEAHQKAETLATATRELHPDGVPKLVKEALLTTRNLSGEGTVNVVSGVVGAGVGIISCAAAVGTWHYARKSMRDKSQADIQLENLRERQTRHVEGLARREAELNLRTREQAAVEERLNERNREQQRCERALDRRSRVNDARESVISRSERGEDSSRRDEREWALNDRSRYLERREDDLRRRRDGIAFDTQNLETALEKQRKEGVAHEQRLEERLQNYRAKLHRMNYQAVLQEIVAAGKTRTLRDERKAFETIAKPLRDLLALQVEHKVAEQERLKVFEMKMQALCDREQGYVAQQESIDVAREDVDLTRQALERQYRELADWHGDVQKQVNQAQDKTEKQRKRLTKHTQEFEAAEREIISIRGDLRKREKDMLQKEAAIDKRGLMLNKEKGAAATRLSELEVREQKCQELLMKMQKDIEHLELNRTTK